jgi:hypothetical protein
MCGWYILTCLVCRWVLMRSFQLYKRDTSYVDIDGDYGVQYQFVGSNYLKASLKQKITIITNVDTAYIKSNALAAQKPGHQHQRVCIGVLFAKTELSL